MTTRPRPLYPRIIAHRCGGALAPENTLPGLGVAARLGCRGVEYDVMLCGDGVPLVVHDETLERTTTGTGCVPDLQWSDMRTIDAGIRHHKAFAGTRIPLFDEVLDHCSRFDLWANIEIKPATGHDSATGSVVAARLAADWSGNGVVSSFSVSALQAVQNTAPQLPVALLFERLPTDWAVLADELNAVAVHLAAAHVSADVARQLRDRTWACYTVNTRDEAKRLFDLGCAAVFTDRPDLWLAAEM